MADARRFLAPTGNVRIRDVLSNGQIDGAVVSPPRYSDLGGLSSAKKGQKKNRYQIRKPGNVAG